MKALLALPLFALAACATTQAGDEPIEVAPQGECDAAPIQSLVGQRTSVELGARIRAESGADAFRWIPAAQRGDAGLPARPRQRRL